MRAETVLNSPLAAETDFYIPPGSSLAAIAATLSAAGAPANKSEIITASQRIGVGKKLRPGHYRIPEGETVRNLLHSVAKGKTVTEKFVIIEGTTVADLRQKLLADARFANNNASNATVSVDDAIANLKIPHDSPEGWFMPETYFFKRPAKAADILRRAYARRQKTLAQAWENRNGDDNTAALQTPYQALILASIVEKETGGKRDEQGLIASVFLNRLRKGMRLQADPTVIYGLGETFDGNLTRKHLRTDTPYNTYTRGGLPPTPIALPGEAAVRAVLSAPESDYYYFVADGGGGHYFSKTLREHNNAVNRYQRRRKKK